MQYNCLLIINLKVENKSDQLLANLFIINVLKKFHFKDCIGNQSLLTLHKNEWDTQLNISIFVKLFKKKITIKDLKMEEIKSRNGNKLDRRYAIQNVIT